MQSSAIINTKYYQSVLDYLCWSVYEMKVANPLYFAKQPWDPTADWKVISRYLVHEGDQVRENVQVRPMTLITL